MYHNVGTLKYKAKAILSKRPEDHMSRIQHAFRQLPQAELTELLSAPVYLSILKTKVKGFRESQNWLESLI